MFNFRAFSVGNYSYYNPGKSISFKAQNLQAQNMYNLISGNSDSNMCSNAIKRFSCVSIFPSCPSEAQTQTGDVSYFSPCKTQCDQMQALCGNLNHVVNTYDCNVYPLQNCMLTMPDSFFALSPVLGTISSCRWLCLHGFECESAIITIILILLLLLSSWWLLNST